jgi:pilus assembly protein CpaE
LERRDLLLIDPDQKTAAFMKHMLSNAGYVVSHVPSGKEGLIEAWRDQPDIIIVELDLPDIDGYELIRKLRSDQRTSETLILGLTSLSDPQIAVRSKEAGLDHYIIKQSDAIDILLQYLATATVSDTGEISRGIPPPRGKFIVFLGVKGGVGTSSLSVNVASNLARAKAGQSVVAIDLALPIGSYSRIIGVESAADIVHLTRLEPGKLTIAYIRERIARPPAWEISLIPGSTTPYQAASFNVDRLASLLQLIGSNFDYAVIDVGRALSQIALLVMCQADAIVIVLIPDEENSTNALAITEFLISMGIERARISYLTNRPLPSEGLTTPSLEKILGEAVLGAIPNMGANFQLANALHAPLHLRFPDERASAALELATQRLITALEPAPL